VTCELPTDLQRKLLRAIQEQEFERLGSSHTTRVNVRDRRGNEPESRADGVVP
jgi:transcriptional regulator of aromatic amino acid metabolism